MINIVDVHYPPPVHEMTPRDLHLVTDFIVHHTAGPIHQTALEIDTEHRNIGDAMIAYNWVIRSDGTIYNGRPPEFVPAAAFGRNLESVNVSLTGNFQKDDAGYTGLPTQEQYASLVELCAYAHKRFPTIVRSIGHRDVAPLFYPNEQSDYSTACPGSELYALLPKMKQAATQAIRKL